MEPLAKVSCYIYNIYIHKYVPPCMQIVELAGYTSRAAEMFNVFREVKAGKCMMTSTVSRGESKWWDSLRRRTNNHNLCNVQV